MGIVRRAATRRAGAVVTAVAAGAILATGCSDGGVSADAGDDFSVQLGEAPEFDGCGSSGDNLSYSWTIVEAPDDMAEDVGKVIRESIGDCIFTLESDMEVADLGTWVIELEVTDGELTEADRVTVTVS